MGRKVLFILLVLILFLPGVVFCAPRLYVSPKAIKLQAEKVPQPLWRLPLGPVFPDEMRLLSPGRLLLGIKKYNPGFSTLDLLLIDSENGSIAWRYDRTKHKGEYSLMAFDGTSLIFRVKNKGEMGLLALGVDQGEEKWFSQFGTVVSFLPLPDRRCIFAATLQSDTLQLTRLDLSSGSLKWKKKLKGGKKITTPPRLLRVDGDILSFQGGLARISGKDGHIVWKRTDIQAGETGPPPKVVDETIYLVNEGNTLQLLDSVEGKTRLAIPLERGLVATAIIPYGKRTYVLGHLNGSGGNPSYEIVSIDIASGVIRWSHAISQPAVSNLLERQGRLYFGTENSIVCLDVVSGKELFSTLVARTGQVFPAQLRNFGKKIVYLGEVIIAAVDAEKGSILYRRGVTPVTALLSMKGLKKAIAKLEKKLAADQTPRPWLSNLLSAQAEAYQNYANTYSSMSLESSRLGNYWDSARFQTLSRMNRTFSKQASIDAFNASIEEMGRAFVAGMKRGYVQEELDRLLLFNRAILEVDGQAEEGEYVFRAHSDFDFVGIKVIHLPTGKASFIGLSPGYKEYGFWNVIDFKKGVVYHHGLGLDPKAYGLSEKFNTVWGRGRMYKSFLIAVPIKLPN